MRIKVKNILQSTLGYPIYPLIFRLSLPNFLSLPSLLFTNLMGDRGSKRGDNTPHFGGKRIQFIKRVLVDIPCVQRDVEMRTHFGAGCFRYQQKLKKFFRAAFATFGDIRHDRNGSALHLAAQAKVACKCPLA